MIIYEHRLSCRLPCWALESECGLVGPAVTLSILLINYMFMLCGWGRPPYSTTAGQ